MSGRPVQFTTRKSEACRRVLDRFAREVGRGRRVRCGIIQGLVMPCVPGAGEGDGADSAPLTMRMMKLLRIDQMINQHQRLARGWRDRARVHGNGPCGLIRDSAAPVGDPGRWKRTSKPWILPRGRGMPGNFAGGDG